MKIKARRNIRSLIPYQAGKPIQELQRELNLKGIIKLASNENPLGCSFRARAAIEKNLSNINRYPEGSCFYLRKNLARKLRVGQDYFVFGNGSDELIDIIIKTFVEEDENIITADITFLEYQLIAQVLGREVVKVGLRKDFCYDLQGMFKRINKKTRVIFIANPNNPTGTYVNKNNLEEFLNRVPKGVIVVLDEAYDIFVDVDDFPKSIEYLKKNNIIILKTFSKSYGLAGLRIGYAVTHPELASFMEKARPPFNVNALAQVAALASLEDEHFLVRTRKTVLAGKHYLYRALEDLGIKYIPSVANFILIDLECSGIRVFKEMLKYGIIVRDMQQYGLKNFIRVTIGTKKENERFIKVLKKILNCY